MNNNTIETMTDAYLVSYTRAMDKTRNSNIAGQAASAIALIVSFHMQMDLERQIEQNPMEIVSKMFMDFAKDMFDESNDDPDPDA